MTITQSNYQNTISNLSISKLPDAFKNSHETMKKATNDFKSWNSVNETDKLNENWKTYSRLLSLYMQKNNINVSEPETKKEVSKKLVSTSTKVKEKKQTSSTRNKKRKITAKPKKTKSKTTVKPQKTRSRTKSIREKKAEVPFWLQTIRGFISLANKERTQTSIRKFLYDLQAKFDATRSKCEPTPHIKLIKKIQDTVIKSVNKNVSAKKITVSVNQSFIDELKKVTKTVIVSTKLAKPKAKKQWLSGVKKKDNTKNLAGLGVVPVTELQKMNFKTLPFTGDWKKLIGNPSVPFHLMFYGSGGSGKSTLTIQLAHYLAEHHNMKVLFLAKEEGISQTAQEKFKRLNAYHKNIFISDGSNLDAVHNFDAAVFDSVNELGLSPDNIRNIIKKYPKLSTIQIFKATKDGRFLGQNDFMHMVQAQFKCEDGTCYPEKNRFGGNETIKIKF